MPSFPTRLFYIRTVCENVLTKTMEEKMTEQCEETLRDVLSISYSCKVVAAEQSYSSEPVHITAHLDEDFSSL